MSRQDQFLEVIDRDEAERRFREVIRCEPLGSEQVPLEQALGRVLAGDVVAPIDVPGFDRSNYDGFALRAADTYGAAEEQPLALELLEEVIATAVTPHCEVSDGHAVSIATGGMLPRGADAVVMVEHTDVEDARLLVRRAVTPGFGVAFAGTDIAAGEIVLRLGELLSSRETGVLAAVGQAEVTVWRRPRVAVISTGDEIIPPNQMMQPGLVYDSNARILADAIREIGAEPRMLGIVRDDLPLLQRRLAEALQSCDVVLLSGGTSKGAGDLSYHAVRALSDPGIVAHGVALKPGKPICLAASRQKPVVVLPGFPTSAIFTFHEFVAPVIGRLGGRSHRTNHTAPARLAVKINSEIGRTEFLLVGLVERTQGQEGPNLAAFPMGKGSGSVTTFSRADGFVTIGRHEEILPEGTTVQVQLLSGVRQAADLVVIGSHCTRQDRLLSRLQQQGISTKFFAVGSTAGLDAVRRGECDLAGIHLLDPESGEYNRPFLSEGLTLIAGYPRMQGLVFRRGDERFEGRTAREAIEKVKHDGNCIMVNRNQGSGTRILIDQLLGDARPAGYAVQSRSHNAVAASVRQGRADWGLAIQEVARDDRLVFLPLVEERFDFAVAQSRLNRPAVRALCNLLDELE